MAVQPVRKHDRDPQNILCYIHHYTIHQLQPHQYLYVPIYCISHIVYHNSVIQYQKKLLSVEREGCPILVCLAALPRRACVGAVSRY